MKDPKFIASLTESEVWDRIRHPEEYSFSTFTKEDFSDWMDYVTQSERDEGYSQGYEDGSDPV